MSQKKAFDATVLTSTLLGSLVLINVISAGVFGRLDLTHDNEFTLSAASRSTIKSLTDPVTIRAYFTRDLPPPYSTNARYVRDLLEEYYAASNGKVRYEFIDPVAAETEADKEAKKEVKQDIFGRAIREETSVERELRQQGIPPIQVRVNEGDKLEVKQAYMGIVVRQNDRKEVLPVVQDTAGLEYNLTTAIRKVSRGAGSEGVTTPKIALVTGKDGPDPKEKLSRLVGLLQQLYEVSFFDITGKTEIPEDLSAILVIGPKNAFTETEQKAIDQFIMSGKSAAFLVAPVSVELRKLESTPLEHGLEAMLAAYGVEIKPGLVLDRECANLTVSQTRGIMTIQQPVNYPFMPMPKSLNPRNPLTRGMEGAAFPFMSPLAVGPTETGVTVDVLVKTSGEGWVVQPPYNLDPFLRWTRDMQTDKGEKPIIITASGPLKSYFAKKAEEESVTAPVEKHQAEDARVLVAGGYAFATDEFLTPGNQALMLNMVDWLVRDDALLAIRSRGLAAAPIDPNLSDSKRNTLKYLNIVGVPLLMVGIGLVRWRMRESRRSRVTL